MGRGELIKALHAKARHLGLEEETRRDIMERATGKRSAADMTLGELATTLDAMSRGHAPHADYRSRWRRKARALWHTAWAFGAIDHDDDAALEAFAQRQTGVARIDWVTGGHGVAVIEAIKSMIARASRGFLREGRYGLDAYYHAEALYVLARERGLVGGDLPLDDQCMGAWAAAHLGLPRPVPTGKWTNNWDYATCGQVIDALGPLWRAHVAKGEHDGKTA
jgi:hypothetical protein